MLAGIWKRSNVHYLALQTSDENKCAMPLNWHPGDKVIVPAPKTIEALAERKASNLEMVIGTWLKGHYKLFLEISFEKVAERQPFYFYLKAYDFIHVLNDMNQLCCNNSNCL